MAEPVAETLRAEMYAKFDVKNAKGGVLYIAPSTDMNENYLNKIA